MANRDACKIQMNLARAALQKGDREGAREVCQETISAYPDCGEAWLILAAISDPEKRSFYLQRAQEIAPEDPYVLRALDWFQTQTVGEQPPDLVQEAITDPENNTPSENSISPLQASENHSKVWIWVVIALIALSLLFFGLDTVRRESHFSNGTASALLSTEFIKATQTGTPVNDAPEPNIAAAELPTPVPSSSPTISPTPDPVPSLYGCAIEILFTSGPLEGDSTSFSMLEESYFYDKDDKFDTGKNTGIFYKNEHYVVLHSGYHQGNPLKPLEIEFLRKYLEHWGDQTPSFIEGQIEGLVGSQLTWSCDGKTILKTRVKDTVRLSHEASNRLWLEPENIFEILTDREGIATEWIGEITPTDPAEIYLGFCGWGPASIKQGRSVYYRYLVQLEILD